MLHLTDSLQPTPVVSSVLRLPDGRRLGWAETGRPRGPPVLHFHGHGSSRLEIGLVAEAAHHAGIRLIGLDRPGFGLSDPQPNRRILDWPTDVVEVANQLGLKRFGVMGMSGGAIYALACVHRIPRRLTVCGIVSGVPPARLVRRSGPWWMRATWWMERNWPGVISLVDHLSGSDTGGDEQKTEDWLLRYGPRFGAPDHQLLWRAEIRHRLSAALAEGQRQGPAAHDREARLGVRPWGFELRNLDFDRMFLWHGEQDRVVPVSMARGLVALLPQCTATFFPAEGHFSTPVNRGPEIMETVATAHGIVATPVPSGRPGEATQSQVGR